MVEIINLRRSRKQRDKKEQKDEAAQNRVNFGRSKQQKDLVKRLNTRAEHNLDSHKLTRNKNNTD